MTVPMTAPSTRTPITVSKIHFVLLISRVTSKKKEPQHYDEFCGRQYEVVRLIAGVIRETNEAMRNLRDYELEGYKDSVLDYMKKLRERKEKSYISGKKKN